MSDISRNHHYIPQYYLRGFLDPNLKKKQLHVIDMIGGRHFVTTPRNVGSQRDFNRVNIPGKPIDEVEKTLAEMDTAVARVLRYVKENETLPTGGDLEILIYFVALLYMHNPRIRNNLTSIETMVIKQFTKALFFRPERYESYRQQEKAAGKDLPEYETMKQFVESENYDIRYGHGHHLRYELEIIDNVVFPLFSQRKWSLFIAEDGAGAFICSDHPVALMSVGNPPPNPDHPYNIGGPGLAHSDTELTVPLNHRMALFAIFKGPSYVGMADEKIVANVNVRTIGSAAKRIYCSNLDFKFLENGKMKNGRDSWMSRLCGPERRL